MFDPVFSYQHLFRSRNKQSRCGVIVITLLTVVAHAKELATTYSARQLFMDKLVEKLVNRIVGAWLPCPADLDPADLDETILAKTRAVTCHGSSHTWTPFRIQRFSFPFLHAHRPFPYAQSHLRHSLFLPHTPFHVPQTLPNPHAHADQQMSRLNEMQNDEDANDVALQPGLTHLWTTPICRYQLIEVDGPNADLLRLMEAAVLRKFRAFAETIEALEDDETINDSFFFMQQEAFEACEPSFLEAEGSADEIQAFDTLRIAILENAYAYLASAASHVAASAVFHDHESLRMFVWASVHEGHSTHVPHDHPNTTISGVLYVATPPHAGMISFEDPRMGRPPFDANRLDHVPIAGELLLFPPWLIHSVGSSVGASAPRISISFNIFTMRDGDLDYKELADTSVAAESSSIDDDDNE